MSKNRIAVFALLLLWGCEAAMAQSTVTLTLEEAIQRGLQHNLGGLLAEARIAETEGTLQRRGAALLPRARIETPVTIQSVNLRAQGISFPGVPEVVGPFTTYQFRVAADQPILDLQLLHIKRAASKQVDVAKKDYEQTRNELVRGIAGLYLAAQSASAQVAAAEARVRTAETLRKLAYDQKDSGVATGIDVVRADVRLSRERQSVVVARNNSRNALLVLARNLGMSPGTQIVLAEILKKTEIKKPDIDSAIQQALAQRADYQSMELQKASLLEQTQASKARFLPRLSISGNYGGVGRTFSSLKGVGLAQASLQFTLFDRDREGELKELIARQQRIERQMSDLRLGVEQEIRQALLNLESAQEELGVAEASASLAAKELDLATVRFQNGVTNNVEVVNAQDSLSQAQQDLIVALTRHADARINLSYALGGTEQNFRKYLSGR